MKKRVSRQERKTLMQKTQNCALQDSRPAAYLNCERQAATGRQIRSVQNAFLALDEMEYGFKNKIPLWLFGFLY